MAKVSHIVLPVSNLPKSRDWYVDKLGFTVEREQEGVLGIKDQSGLTIFLQGVTGGLPGHKLTLTIQVDSVDRKYEELANLGVAFTGPPQLQFWGYGAEALDPDGYTNHLWDEVTMNRAMQEARGRQD